MTITTLPTRAADDLGPALTNTRTPRANEASAVNYEKIKDRLIELGAEVGKSDGSTAGSLNARVLELEGSTGDFPTATRVAGFDDFTDPSLPGWSVDTTTGGAVEHSFSAAAYGFPGAGCVKLGVDATPGASAVMYRAGTGLVLGGADAALVVEWRYRPIDDEGALSDIEHQRILGMTADGELADAIVLAALWDDGTATRTHALYLLRATVVTEEPVTMPALGAGTGYLVRLTATLTGVTLEVGIDDGALATVATIAAAPTEAVYVPIASVAIEGGAGDHAVMIDLCRWSAGRLSDDAGAPTGAEFSPVTGGGVADHGALTGLADDDHPQYLLADGSRTVTGPLLVDSTVDGRDVSADGATLDAHVGAGGTAHANAVASGAAGFLTGADKAKLDGIATSAAAVGSGVVAVARANSNGSSASAARADHVHDGAPISVTAVKTSAYTILPTDDVVLVDDTAGRVDLTAPALASRGVMIQKVAGGTGGIRIIRTASEEINGVAASYDLPGATTAWASATPQAWYLYSDGTKRYVA